MNAEQPPILDYLATKPKARRWWSIRSYHLATYGGLYAAIAVAIIPPGGRWALPTDYGDPRSMARLRLYAPGLTFLASLTGCAFVLRAGQRAGSSVAEAANAEDKVDRSDDGPR